MTQKKDDFLVCLWNQGRKSNRDIHDALVIHGKDVITVPINIFQTCYVDLKILIDQMIDGTQLILKHITSEFDQWMIR